MVEVDEQVIKGGLAFQQSVFLPQCRIFFPLSQQIGTELQKCLRGSSHLPQLFLGHIGSVLADRRQHLVEHPSLKPFRRGKFAVDDQAIEIPFTDKLHFLFAAQIIGEVVKRHPIFAAMCFEGIYCVFVPQCFCGIQAAEQILAILLNDADTAKLLVIENFNLTHIVPPLA